MLGAPPAFILSQDRTLRSVSAGRSRRRCSARRSVPSKIPLISDSLKLTSLCVRDSNFAGLSSSISRSQYPVLKVPPRRAAAVAAPSRGELYAPRAPARARKSPSTFSAQFGGRGRGVSLPRSPSIAWRLGTIALTPTASGVACALQPYYSMALRRRSRFRRKSGTRRETGTSRGATKRTARSIC